MTYPSSPKPVELLEHETDLAITPSTSKHGTPDV